MVAIRSSGQARRISRAGTTLFLALSLTGMIRTAYADCTQIGSIVTCSGTTAAGFSASGDGLNITIGAGAEVLANTAANPSLSFLVNNGNTVVNDGIIKNTGGSQTNNYAINLNGSNNTFINDGQVELSITAEDIAATNGKNTRTLRGIYTSASSTPFENNTFINNGTVILRHAGIGNAQGVYPGEDIDGITFDNYGTFAVERTSALTISVSGGNVFAAANGLAAAGLGVAAAISSDDDAEMEVINRASGVIEATGDYTAAMYVRAVELELVNYGVIRNNSGAIAISAHGGAAGEAGELEIQNFGTIEGDVLAVDANALRYWGANAKGLSGLTFNNQAGVRNSEIENHGEIEGNIYLGSGTHVIENEGEIEGNIRVDQAGIGTAIGARSFTLINEGEIEGNIQILDVAGATNHIVLVDDGFSGSITATGAGSNTLSLLGNGTVPVVEGITALNVGIAPAAGEDEGGDDDDDDEGGGGGGDDDDDEAASAASVWTIASGNEVEVAGETSIGNGGVLIVDGELASEEVNILAYGSLIVNGEVEAEEVNVRAGGLLVVDGEVEIDGDDDEAGVHVSSGGTLMGFGTIEGSVFNSGTIDLRNGRLTVEGPVHMAAGSVLRTTVFGPGGASADEASDNAGQLVVTETGTVEAGAVVVPVSKAGVVRSGDWYRIAHNESGEKVFDALPQVQNTALISWQIQENAENDLVIGATVRQVNEVPGITTRTAGTLNALLTYNGPNEKLLALASLLQGLTNADDLRKAGEQLRPSANNASSQAAGSATDRVFSLIDNRVSQTQLAGVGATGVSTGESDPSRGLWVQGFGFTGTQDQRDGVDGYSADAVGLAIGADTAVGSGDTRLGAAFSYADSSVEDDGVNSGNTTDVKSYQLSLYGSWKLDANWYVNGSLGLGQHQYDTRRVIRIGGGTEVATGSHDGDQYSARVEIGRMMKAGNTTIIPVAGVYYSYLKQDGYTETSTGGAALAIEGVSTDSIRSALGAKAEFGFGEQKKDTLQLRAMWLHEFGDTTQDTTSTFAAGGASFTTSGVKQSREAFNAGASFTFAASDNTYKVTLSYDAEIRDQYLGHTAFLQARHEF